MKKKLGLYVHVPFCLAKCKYCGFLSFAGCEDRIDEYFDALIREIDVRFNEAPAGTEGARFEEAPAGAEGARFEEAPVIDTVFFGGGTPSLATPKNIKRVLQRLTPYLEEGAEITMEANPKTFDEVSLRAYREAGVNRLSIGFQSLDDEVLKKLGRVHTKSEFLEGYEAARRAGFDNINVDLMFAVPGQNMQLWKETLCEVVSLEPAPEHISAYSLQIEEGTPFYNEYKFGKLDGVSDAEERRMHKEAIVILQGAGYEHYEISNFAKRTAGERREEKGNFGGERREGQEPFGGNERCEDQEPFGGGEWCEGQERDYRCRHNLKYWNMDEYLGVGLGASSFVNGVRTKNIENLEEYISKSASVSDSVFNGESRADTFVRRECGLWFIGERHSESRADLAGETVFTGLRKREGFLKSRFEEIVGESYDDFFHNIYKERVQFIKEGLLVEDEDRVYLTEEGMEKSNQIMCEFV